jgi:hypothetical protein
MDDGLGKRKIGLWQANKMNGLLGSNTNEESLGIGHTNVFRSETNEATHDV